MSAQPTIGVVELWAICEWLERTHHPSTDSEPGGDKLDEWAEARSIDIRAVCRFAADQADTMFRELADEKLNLREGVMATAIIGFQLGIDAERRRRDRAELPEADHV